MAEEHLEVAGQGAGLAAGFGPGIERLGIERLGLAVVNNAMTGEGDAHRDHDVIENGIGGRWDGRGRGGWHIRRRCSRCRSRSRTPIAGGRFPFSSKYSPRLPRSSGHRRCGGCR